VAESSKYFVQGNVSWLDEGNNLALLFKVVAGANTKAICCGYGNSGPGYHSLPPYRSRI
jgi:hypothetical protein